MKKLLVIYIILALTSCTTGNDEPDFGVDPGTAISFFTGVDRSIITRAPIETPLTNSVVGVQILRKDGITPITEIGPAVTTAKIDHTTFNNGYPMQLTDPQYFKPTHEDVYFRAYYPVGTLAAGIVKYTINGTQDIITSDEPKAEYGDGSDQTVNFTFEHQLAHVVLKIKAKDNNQASVFGKLTKASIEVPVKLDLSIDDVVTPPEFKLSISSPRESGDLSFLPNNTPINLQGGVTDIGELMIFPESLTSITLKFENRKEETINFSWDPVLNELKPGTTNTITITLDPYEIKYKISVEPWNPGTVSNPVIPIG